VTDDALIILRGVYPADLDSDGDIDIYYTIGDATGIYLLENTANNPSVSGVTYWDVNNNNAYDDVPNKWQNLCYTWNRCITQ
jgi:hypothetical protein